MRSNEIWLAKTKQLWKFYIFVFGVMVGFLLIIFQSIGIIENGIIEPITISVEIFAFLWLFISIRCPSCKRRPMFSIIRKSNISQLTRNLIGFESCPHCGC